MTDQEESGVTTEAEIEQDSDAAVEQGGGAMEVPLDEEGHEVDPMSEGEMIAAIEAVVFAAEEPIAVSRLKEVTGLGEKEVQEALEAIEMKFEHEESGIELCCVGGKYQFRTKGRFGSFIRELKAGRPRRLSGQALETLAIVAYRQPIVKSDVEKIRGVDATPTLKTLVERKLIKIVGHQPSVGQPALYGTTDEFLKLFGMASLGELPSLRDIQELMQEPGEVGEASGGIPQNEDDSDGSDEESSEGLEDEARAENA